MTNSLSTSAVELDCSVSTARTCSGGLIGLSEKRLVGRNSSRRPPSSTVRFSRKIPQQQRDEDVVGCNIQQRPFPRALAHGGESARVVTLAIESHPLDLHRQHVALGHAALGRFEEREPWPIVADVAERDRRGQRRDGSPSANAPDTSGCAPGIRATHRVRRRCGYGPAKPRSRRAAPPAFRIPEPRRA